jgi:AraC family transcriptional regulator
MDDAIERAIECIWERYSEPLSLTQIAESALLSRFYFARLFRDATGITPGRFLAATRIHQAKRLLLSTPMSITDISSAVGYNSLGSFTNYFTASVGVSPGQFRRLSRTGGFGLPLPPADPRTGFGAVAGPISLPAGQGSTRVYIGAFSTLIMQHPAAAAIVADVPIDRPACYYLPDVPEGTWFVHAVGVADGPGAIGAGSIGAGADPSALCADRAALIGRHDSVTVTEGNVTSAAVRLRYAGPADPPVLLALPDLLPPRSLAVATGRPAS